MRFFSKPKEAEKVEPDLTLGSKSPLFGSSPIPSSRKRLTDLALANDDEADELTIHNNYSNDMLGRTNSVTPQASQEQPRNIQVNQNWFARFFHIKPATRVLSLNISKPRARKEIVRILRDWKRYGRKDISVDKATGLGLGRVDANNCKSSKALSPLKRLNRAHARSPPPPSQLRCRALHRHRIWSTSEP